MYYLLLSVRSTLTYTHLLGVVMCLSCYVECFQSLSLSSFLLPPFPSLSELMRAHTHSPMCVWVGGWVERYQEIYLRFRRKVISGTLSSPGGLREGRGGGGEKEGRVACGGKKRLADGETTNGGREAFGREQQRERG